jgi:4a-hydroxytetrahydrobiopterin dehydratase
MSSQKRSAIEQWGIFGGTILLMVELQTIFALSLPVTRLTPAEITQQRQDLPQWQVHDDRLERTFSFKTFVEAIAFVNRLVEPAESLGHHPDITIHYNRVTIALSTHDVGGLSQLDFDLARQISRLAEK